MLEPSVGQKVQETSRKFQLMRQDLAKGTISLNFVFTFCISCKEDIFLNRMAKTVSIYLAPKWRYKFLKLHTLAIFQDAHI
jgi:hypothetical protein